MTKMTLFWRLGFRSLNYWRHMDWRQVHTLSIFLNSEHEKILQFSFEDVSMEIRET